MSYTNGLDDPTAYFQTTLYTGDGSTTHAITNGGNSDLQPDMVWIKDRGAANWHSITDVARGHSKAIFPNDNAAEDTSNAYVKAFNSDGFTLGSAGSDVNANSNTYVSWQWKANGSGNANTAGSINTTATSANTTSGFSIITYTGNGSSGATIGHGLSTAPQAVFIKKRTAANWTVGHVGVGWTKNGKLNTIDSFGVSALSFNNTAPSTSLITLGSGDVANANGGTYVCYAFSNIKGFSKMGSYTGNGNANGPFCFTGFKPAFAIFKDITGDRDWTMLDNKRNTFNVMDKRLFPNNADAENDTDILDFTSNGIKIRSTNTSVNVSGNTYIYMAFAENPFVTSSGVPATAR